MPTAVALCPMSGVTSTRSFLPRSSANRRPRRRDQPAPIQIAQGLPRTWDEIAVGHLVIAQATLEYGWWEVHRGRTHWRHADTALAGLSQGTKVHAASRCRRADAAASHRTDGRLRRRARAGESVGTALCVVAAAHLGRRRSELHSHRRNRSSAFGTNGLEAGDATCACAHPLTETTDVKANRTNSRAQ